MKSTDEMILVSAPNMQGENFIKILKLKNIPFATLVSNKTQKEKMLDLGVENIITLDTKKYDSWIIPDFPVSKIFLFEESLPLSCKYIQICRGWTSDAIYVISHRSNPRMIYKGLGANHVIYSCNGNLSFLI